MYLDGDELREIWGDALGHDLEGRAINAQRISKLCQLLDSQGTHVIAAVLSIFPEWQAWNRETFSQYYEIFLDVPMDIIESRDARGIYKAARLGVIKNVVGVDIPFPRPLKPDLVLKPPEVLETPSSVAARIEEIMPKFKVEY